MKICPLASTKGETFMTSSSFRCLPISSGRTDRASLSSANKLLCCVNRVPVKNRSLLNSLEMKKIAEKYLKNVWGNLSLAIDLRAFEQSGSYLTVEFLEDVGLRCKWSVQVVEALDVLNFSWNLLIVSVPLLLWKSLLIQYIFEWELCKHVVPKSYQVPEKNCQFIKFFSMKLVLDCTYMWQNFVLIVFIAVLSRPSRSVAVLSGQMKEALSFHLLTAGIRNLSLWQISLIN